MVCSRLCLGEGGFSLLAPLRGLEIKQCVGERRVFLGFQMGGPAFSRSAGVMSKRVRRKGAKGFQPQRWLVGQTREIGPCFFIDLRVGRGEANRGQVERDGLIARLEF